MAASYRSAVAWIALNDDAGSDAAENSEAVAGYISTLLVADLFGKPAEKVAADIVKYRREERLRQIRATKQAEETAIVKSNKCPKCGAGLKRNNSLSGWWQCEQYGADQFRKDPAKPPCSWQTFI